MTCAVRHPTATRSKSVVCSLCGGMLIRSYGTEAKWECHNDQCELNRRSAGYDAAVSAATGVVLLVRAARLAVLILVPVAVAWLVWRAL
jgi:hypothetical protein